MENVNFDRKSLEYSAKSHYNNMRESETRGSCFYSIDTHRWINIYYIRENNRNVFTVCEQGQRFGITFIHDTCNKLIDLKPGVSIADKFQTAEDFAAYVIKYVEDNYSKLTDA